MSDKVYPLDVHGAATAVETFSKASAFLDVKYLDQARKTANWGINNMQHQKGYFIYQIGKFHKKRFTLMRWCNGWMAHGLSWLYLISDQLEGRSNP